LYVATLPEGILLILCRTFFVKLEIRIIVIQLTV
jgi:hypothetical protein